MGGSGLTLDGLVGSANCRINRAVFNGFLSGINSKR